MTEPHLRYTTGDKVARYSDGSSVATVLGPAEYHEIGFDHFPDTTFHHEHATKAYWCYHLEMGGAWGATKRRWWAATSVLGREDVEEIAEAEFQRIVAQAEAAKARLLGTSEALSSRETEVIDGRRHTPQADGTCSGCNEVYEEFFDHLNRLP